MQIRCALVGMPGSGKYTVGRQLAHRLGVAFVDLDHRLEQVMGTTIRNYFETKGEERFRDLEARVLAEVAQQPGGLVLSTGWRAGFGLLAGLSVLSWLLIFSRCTNRPTPRPRSAALAAGARRWRAWGGFSSCRPPGAS